MRNEVERRPAATLDARAVGRSHLPSTAAAAPQPPVLFPSPPGPSSPITIGTALSERSGRVSSAEGERGEGSAPDGDRLEVARGEVVADQAQVQVREVAQL